MPQLTFEQLRGAVAGDAVALRSRMTLQPAGGEGDKVFPPSYAVDGRADHKYAVEERQVGESDKLSTTVLLDSVASQANRRSCTARKAGSKASWSSLSPTLTSPRTTA